MNRTPPLALLALATALGPPAAPAQQPSPDVAIAFRPAAEPRPALKYRLAPERRDLEPGNAAIFYHRALLLTNQARTRSAANAATDGEPPTGRPVAVDEPVSRWIAGPIAEIPRDRARAVLAAFVDALKEVDLGASRSACDWEFDRRSEGINVLLPEIQEMRSIARLQALRARLAILDGRLDEAFRRIEDGLTIGRQVGQGPVAIQALVGAAIDHLMVRCLEDWVQAPGAPSLYWALADRPRPAVDLRPALEGERYFLEKELPGLADLDRGPWGLDQARRFADEMQRKLFTLASDARPASESVAPGQAAFRRLGVAAVCGKIYPRARRALIAGGRSEAEVEAMPVIQVSMLVTYGEYKTLRDDSYKWMGLPYWQSFRQVDARNMGTVEEKMVNPLLTLFQFATPPLNAVRLAAVRVDRQLDALQCVELIRLHAAAHGGKLPATLGAITEAPAPLDPATGEPFAYEVAGDSAILSAPIPPGGPNHPSFQIRYVLKPAR